MPKAKIEILSRDEVQFSLLDQEQPSDRVRLSAAEIDDLIAALAQVRSAMAPEVPRMIPEGTRPAGPIDPIWVVPGLQTIPGKLLAIRHPGLGWVMFQFPPAEAVKLGGALTRQQNAASVDSLTGAGRSN